MDAGGKGGSRVEIVSIPWHFLARVYEQLDQLFLPLLSSAQQANDLMGVRARGDSSALQAAAYMCGELLRDSSFTPVKPRDHESSNIYVYHLYQLDFVADGFEVKTSVYSAQATKEALFGVRITGRIRGDKFQVLDSATGTALFSFTRFEAEKPEFFLREFPFLAYESRATPVAGDEQNLFGRETINIMLSVPVPHGSVSVRVEKLPSSPHAEVKNPSTGATVMKVSAGALNNISKMVRTIEEYVASNASAHQLLENADVKAETAKETAEPSQAEKAEPPEVKQEQESRQ